VCVGEGASVRAFGFISPLRPPRRSVTTRTQGEGAAGGVLVWGHLHSGGARGCIAGEKEMTDARFSTACDELEQLIDAVDIDGIGDIETLLISPRRNDVRV
jgi:hypothetical protein